ncbi:hypothetical protein EAH_00037330, partial [Eimeria acervulina]
LTRLVLREYDHLLTKDKIDEEVEGDKLQLERRGYFIFDKVEGDARIFIKIPDGRTKSMSVVSAKVDAAALAGKKKK